MVKRRGKRGERGRVVRRTATRAGAQRKGTQEGEDEMRLKIKAKNEEKRKMTIITKTRKEKRKEAIITRKN